MTCKVELLHFDHNGRHLHLYPNYKIVLQYFCDNLNYCYTVMIKKLCVVQKTACEAVPNLYMTTALCKLAEPKQV